MKEHNRTENKRKGKKKISPPIGTLATVSGQVHGPVG